jgi:hypothetical protein
VPLGEAEKEELRRLAGSPDLREDLARLSASRRRAFVERGAVVPDRVLAFLCEYNEFINHAPRKFRRIVDDLMKL